MLVITHMLHPSLPASKEQLFLLKLSSKNGKLLMHFGLKTGPGIVSVNYEAVSL